MSTLTRLYSSEKVNQLDKMAVEQLKIPALELMTRAGTAAFQFIRQQWPLAKHFAVFCGTGNNAGDGYVLARLLHEDSFHVEVYSVDPLGPSADTAKAAYQEFLSCGLRIKELPQRVGNCDLVIDALLGSGFQSPLKPQWEQAIGLINSSSKPVLALDLPSGIEGKSGRVTQAVYASYTLAFVALRAVLFTGRVRNYTGAVVLCDLGLPQELYESLEWDAELLDYHEALGALKPRLLDSYKGDYGHVAVLGAGALALSGAVCLAGKAALISGAGLVSAVVHPDAMPLMARAPMELMCYPGDARASSLWSKATVWVCGPGLTQSEWAIELFEKALALEKPMVIDADALHLLAKNPKKSHTWVLTPHTGEAAALLGISVEDVQANRIEAVKSIQAEYGGTVVLKGTGTLIGSSGHAYSICMAGNPGMATGGTGDVLAGIIGGLMAQGLEPLAAAKLGVIVHSLAGDLEQTLGERGMTASDLLLHSRSLLNPTQNHETDQSNITQFFNFE